MRTPFITALLIVLLFFGGAAGAQSVDGQELLSKCSAGVKAVDGSALTTQEVVDGSWCAGYLQGMGDMHTVLTTLGSRSIVCEPKEVVLADEVRVVVTFLQAHPEWLRVQGPWLIVAALKQAFACPSVLTDQNQPEERHPGRDSAPTH